MGGATSTQNQYIHSALPADKHNALVDIADIAYKAKDGNGVATVMAIANKTMHKLVYVKEESFSGRWERDAPLAIEPNKVMGMVHRKRDGGVRGSSGYVEYSVRNKEDHEICKVFFGWDTPYWGKNTVGCGWLENSVELPIEEQAKVGYHQSNRQSTNCMPHGLVIEIEIHTHDTSPRLHLIVSPKKFAGAAS